MKNSISVCTGRPKRRVPLIDSTVYVPSFNMENVSVHMVSSKGIQIIGQVYAPLMGVQGKDL